MSGHSSRAGQRVDTYAISDHPHTQYFECGVPVERPAGNRNAKTIIAKQISFSTLCCPDCGAIGYYDDDEEAYCERCGVQLSDPSSFNTDNGDPIVADPKSAGRVDDGA